MPALIIVRAGSIMGINNRKIISGYLELEELVKRALLDSKMNQF